MSTETESVSLFLWPFSVDIEFFGVVSPLGEFSFAQSVRAVDRALRMTAPRGPILKPPLEISKSDWCDFSPDAH